MRISGWLYGIQQCLCAGSLLLALGYCAGTRRPPLWRLLAAALAAGVIATAAAVSERALPRTVALAMATALPRLAWPSLPRALRQRMALCLLTLPPAMVGAARLLYSFGLPALWIVPAVCLLLPLLTRLAPRNEGATSITAEILCGSSRISLTALVDSGNLLRDPLTGLPVIVVSRRAVSQLIPLPPPGEISPGMRLISVRTVSGTGLMAVFRPDRVRLLTPGGWIDVRALIGVSPGSYDGFQALVPSALTSRTHASTTEGG